LSHALLHDARFYELLGRIDMEAADRAREAGCACGDVLHAAHYPRKPRGGLPRGKLVDYEKRWSYCCARDGCRSRSTPPLICKRPVTPGWAAVRRCARDRSGTPAPMM
jgi:hypothetical protein